MQLDEAEEMVMPGVILLKPKPEANIGAEDNE